MTIQPPGRLFDPAVGRAGVSAETPLIPLVFPDGHEGWRAVGYSMVRRVLADPRFSSRSELLHSPVAEEYEEMTFAPAKPGEFLRMDPPEHTRYRKLLAGRFTAQRMDPFTEQIESAAHELLDSVRQRGGPIDLVSAFAQPMAGVGFCELFGVPHPDRKAFLANVITYLGADTSPNKMFGAFLALSASVRDLTAAKRAEPVDDLLSDLAGSDLTDDELATVSRLILVAGLQTTATMIGMGTFALLQNPGEWAALCADRDLVDTAVEELMRYLTIIPTLARVALEDVEFDGIVVKSGSTVVLSTALADRDPAKFDDPHILNLRRNAAGHLGFGHGPHLCVGLQLARVMMRVAWSALSARFPGLRLAIPAEDVPMLDEEEMRTLESLPVTW